MVTSVYNLQNGGQNASETTDHIRKRKITLPSNTTNASANRSRNVSKLIKFKNATVNWLNGLPPTDYDSALYEFNADNHNNHETENDSDINSNTAAVTTDKMGFKRKLKKFTKLFKNSEKRRELEEAAVLLNEQNTSSSPIPPDDSPFEKVGKIQNLEETQYMEMRSKVREIFLPPDVAGQRKFLRNLTPKMRKKFAESHPWTVSNEIHTAKYTVLTFIPKNLFEQFRRVANVYFLILIILQGIPIFSNTNIFLAASPLFSILLVTAVKDAMEDWKRQKSDNKVNHSLVKVLERVEEEGQQETREEGKTGFINWIQNLFKRTSSEATLNATETGSDDGWKLTHWKDIRVGDIVMILNNESIPADILVISTSDSHGICYVETKNLDGETNLKIRQAPKQTSQMTTAEAVSKLNAVFQVEQPSTKLYTFAGKMVLPTEEAQRSQENLMDAEAFPITPDNLLLRGCQIRNTEFVIGVVAYTGPHSKIIMNSGKTPSKRSRIEKQMNPQIILSFVLLIVICLTCAIMQGQYVGGSISQAPYWYTVYKTGAMASPIFTGFLTFWSSLILFQTLVPISLYITVEICKLVQAGWIHWDLNMYYPERDQRAVPRSWNIADDLGQIEYIFSDKTGTLTRNVMEFRKCSIGAKSYGYLPEDASNTIEGQAFSSVSQDQFDSMEAKMADCLGQVLPYKYVPPSQMSFVDPALFTDMLNTKPTGKEQSERIINFFFSLIVCHTILIDKLGMTEEVLNESLTENPSDDMVPHLLQYQAQSPDEAALVKAARDLGFVFLGRDQEFLNLSILGKLERIQVLSVIEFNSTRKRMSVIIKKTDGTIWLISKGADSVIYERLRKCRIGDDSEKSTVLDSLNDSKEQDLRDETMKHLENFAESGLRTLCFSSRQLSSSEYANFSLRHAEASTAMNNREMLMDAVAEEYERELNLLGCTAIEDRLQDGVPDTISNLQMAGIKIWVLTGDKMETAVNIGFSCKLLTRKMNLIMIKSDDSTVEATRKQLDDGFRKMSFTTSSMNVGESDLDAEMESWYPTGTDGVKPEYALIIDGTSLKHALEDRQCRPIFLDLATNCKAVLCCRVSPLQKAKCVELVKKTRNVMTLAIGDGANDVSMIQEADVGIGIAGEEGMQAVMSSDYAIAQFSYLERLLLVHGRLSYVRTAKITLLSFCKNVSFVLVAFWFQIYCAFTAQYTYDYMYLLYFNMFFTMLPVLLLGFFDQQVANDKLQKVPQLYADGIKQKYYSMKLFLQYSAVAIYQSLMCYFVPQLLFMDISASIYGFPESKTMIGNVQAFSIILTINLFTASHMESWNLFFAAGLVLTALVFLGFVIVYMLVPLSDMYGSWGDFLTVPFWAAIILTVTLASIPTFLYPFVRGWIWPKRPSDIEIIREIEAFSEEVKTQPIDVEDLEQGGQAHKLSLHDQLMDTVKDAQLRANSSIVPAATSIKWTHRGHENVSLPPRTIPVIRADGKTRLRTLTSSSNEFATEREPESSHDTMENIALHSNSRAGMLFDQQIQDYTTNRENEPINDRSQIGILSRSKTLRRLKEKFKLFNLRTGKMEKISGFAFAQDSGAARTIISGSETSISRPQDALLKK